MRWRMATVGLAVVVLNACRTNAPRPPLSPDPASPAPTVTVSPGPGTKTASPQTQISFRGVPEKNIGTIVASGSKSGDHPGRLLPHSDGNGASFLPNVPFRAGEVVTVRSGLRVNRAKAGVWTFTVARSAPTPALVPPPQQSATPTSPTPARSSAGGSTPAPAAPVQSFRSQPNINPPTIEVTTDKKTAAPGDVFIAPKSGGGQSGPMIVDDSGQVVWFDPISSGKEADDFRVQSYEGRSVLTWFQGKTVAGHGQGVDVVMDASYKTVATVHAGNGYEADLHEFLLSPQNTAFITIFNPVQWRVPYGRGTKSASVMDGIVQEVDIKTGLVLFEWHSLDHVEPDESYSTAAAGGVFDYFHINSIGIDGTDKLLVSARNTHALYDVSRTTGSVAWRLGGKQSNFTMGPGTAFAWQHDARRQPDGTITIFDDEAGPKVRDASRAIDLRLDTTKRTATLVRALEHPGKLLAASQGNEQVLSNGDVFVGWGSQPKLSEFDRTGALVFDASLPGTAQSYRAYRFTWSAHPTDPPAVAVDRSSGETMVFASWNGATNVVSWEVLGGPSATSLKPLGEVAREGFETSIPTTASQPFVAVRALDSSGKSLATSKVIAVGGQA